MSAIVGKKLGMTRIFTEDGTSVPVTVIEAQPNKVTAIRRADRDGYDAIQLAADPVTPEDKLTKGELGLRELALGHVAVAELHGVVAVALLGAQAGDPARAGLHDGDALDHAVLDEQLGHPDLCAKQRGHQTSWIWMSTPAGRWSSRWSESTVFGVG